MSLAPHESTPHESLPMRGLRRLVEGLSVLLFASYCTIILLQVFYRYVLNDSLVWSEEAVRFQQFWLIMLATGLCAQRRAHIRLEDPA
jgi:TRAP-type transport system small permease protein